MRSCWPLRAMPELLGRRKWSMMQDMSYKQRVLLDAKLADHAGLEPDEARAIAAELGLAFQQVGMHVVLTVSVTTCSRQPNEKGMSLCTTTLYVSHSVPRGCGLLLCFQQFFWR